MSNSTMPPSCVPLPNISINKTYCNGGYDEPRFCSGFGNVSYVYLILSIISVLCCCIVFLTFLLIKRVKGYSSRAFLFRTLLDALIGCGHILLVIVFFATGENRFGENNNICAVLGFLFEFALVGSNLWYTLLAVDLIRAIRNPFGSPSGHTWKHHVIIWSLCILALALLAASNAGEDGVGTGISMFFFCWISTNTSVSLFTVWSFFLYFGPHLVLWFSSFVINIFAFCILMGGFPASNETKRHILRQNAIYVLVLGMETTLIIPFWLAQLIISATQYSNSNKTLCFMDNSSLTLAFLFAIVHSSRGIVDLIVWWFTFSINCKDIRDIWMSYKALRYRNLYLPKENLHTPLMGSEESRVNKILRKDVIYCINYAILDAVKLNAQEENQRTHLGSVRDPFMAQVMLKWDEEVHQRETQERHADPNIQEVRQRRIPFRPSNTLRNFSFIDIEPTIFGLLRSSYGVDPIAYQQSFQIKDDQDVESSGMLEKFTEGKSGSFFYFTRDYRYIIKTVTSEEEEFLQKIAYRYYEHMLANPDSVIVRLYGLHKVRLARTQTYISVVVMENLFHNGQNLKMTERYDLKGSTIGRRVLKGNEKREERFKKTLKDMDLNTKIVIGTESKLQLMEQLRKDVEFLSGLHIMDYSMLLGIHYHTQEGSRLPQSRPIEVEGGDDFTKVTFGKPDNSGDIPLGLTVSSSPGGGTLERGAALAQRRPTFGSDDMLEDTLDESIDVKSPHVQWYRRDFGGLRSFSPHHPLNLQYTDGGSLSIIIPDEGYEGFDISSLPNATYYFGIVDILQQYNFSKKMENFTKTRLLRKDKDGISSIDEKRYAQRFLNSMNEIFV